MFCFLALQVLHLDLQRASNTIAHRTNEFMTEKLVVRRGEPFSMKVMFNRAVQPEDNLKWWTQTGNAFGSSQCYKNYNMQTD